MLNLLDLEKWIGIAREYAHLSALSSLTEVEADRMGTILELATREPLLNFWIQEIDCGLAEVLQLLDESSLELYSNQQARLGEHHLSIGDPARTWIARAYYGTRESDCQSSF